MPRSKSDQVRLDAIHDMPCIACEKEKADPNTKAWLAEHGLTYEQPSRTEAHHLVDKGYRKHSGGHHATLPLCGWHHRADVLGCHLAKPPTISNCDFVYGPSLGTSKKRFIATYGTERQLLAETDSKLEQAA